MLEPFRAPPLSMLLPLEGMEAENRLSSSDISISGALSTSFIDGNVISNYENEKPNEMVERNFIVIK